MLRRCDDNIRIIKIAFDAFWWDMGSSFILIYYCADYRINALH